MVFPVFLRFFLGTKNHSKTLKINPNKLSNSPSLPNMIKNGIDKTIGGIIRCDIKKNVMSLFLIKPALKVKRDNA